MKVLFSGSPESSAQILNYLVKEGFKVIGAISQPNKKDQIEEKKHLLFLKKLLNLGSQLLNLHLWINPLKKKLSS